MITRFKRKNQFWDTVDIWTSPVFANLLWIVFSLLVLTLPLGLVGLIATIFHWGENRRTQVFSIFFGTIRRVWLKAYLLFALDLLIFGLLFFNLFIFQMMNMADVLAFLSRSVTLLVGIIFLAVNIPAWVLVATWDAPLKQILKTSLRLVFAEPLGVLLLLIAVIVPIFSSLYLPAVVLVFITGAVVAYIAYKGSYHLLAKYLAPSELAQIEIA